MKSVIELTKTSNMALEADFAMRNGEPQKAKRLYLDAGAMAMTAILNAEPSLSAIRASLMNNAVGYFYKAGDYNTAVRLCVQYLGTTEGRLLESRLEDFMVASIQAKQLSARLSDTEELAPFISTLHPIALPSGMATPKQVSAVNELTATLINAVAYNESAEFLSSKEMDESVEILSGVSLPGSYRQLIWVISHPVQSTLIDLDGNARAIKPLPHGRELVQKVLHTVRDFTTLEPEEIKRKFPREGSRLRLLSALRAFSPTNLEVESVQFSDSPTSPQVVIDNQALVRVRKTADAEAFDVGNLYVEGLFKEAEHQSSSMRFTLKGFRLKDQSRWEERVHVMSDDVTLGRSAMAFFWQKEQARVGLKQIGTARKPKYRIISISPLND